jgi:hypothetical protein
MQTSFAGQELEEFYGRVPIVFGVTGHKDVVQEDYHYVTREVVRVLRSYRAHYPNSPIILLSPLAEGADQIVARAALSVEGITLAAIIPMPIEAYHEDFVSPESRAEFDELKSKAAWVHVTGFDLSQRNELYESCGRYVASLSHILIAVWNGHDNKKQGGTAATLNYKLKGCFDYRDSEEGKEGFLGRNETGVVLEILIKRRSEPHVTPKSRAEWKSNEFRGRAEGVIGATENKDFDDTVARLIDRYNSDARTECLKPGYLCQARRGHVDAFFKVTDRLALKYQRRSKIVIQMLFFVGVVAIMTSQINQNVHTNETLVVELISIFVVWALWLFARVNKLKEKHEEYRSLAEAARVQVAWQDSGLTAHVADCYLSAQVGELDWLRRSIRSVQALDTWSGVVAANPTIMQLLQVRNNWMQDQYVYYDGAPIKPGKIIKFMKNGIKLAKYAKIFLAAGMAFVFLRFPYVSETLNPALFPDPLVHFITLTAPYLAPLSLALAASLKAYGELMSYTTLSRRYKSMAAVLSRGLEMFDHLEASGHRDSVGRMQKLVFHVGREALIENGDWIIGRRQRDLQPLA